MAPFYRIAILMLPALRSAIQVPSQSSNPFQKLNGQPLDWFQPYNQDGQSFNPPNQKNPTGQFVNRFGQVVGQDGQPLMQSPQPQSSFGNGGGQSGNSGQFGNGGMLGNGGGQGRVVNTGSPCTDPSVPKPENDYGTNGDCGTVRNPNTPNGVRPGDNPDGTRNGYDYTNDNPDGTTIIFDPSYGAPDGTRNNWDWINTNL